MWRISAPGITFNNPGIIDLFSYKAYVGPHKGGYRIVNCNPRCIYYPLVPKRDTFYVTDGSPMRIMSLTFNCILRMHSFTLADY